MSPFWWGVIVGLAVGVPAGLWMMAMAVMAGRRTLPELEGEP